MIMMILWIHGMNDIIHLFDYIFLNSSEECHIPYNNHVVSIYINTDLDVTMYDYGYITGHQEMTIKKYGILIANLIIHDDGNITHSIINHEEYEVLMLKYMYSISQSNI